MSVTVDAGSRPRTFRIVALLALTAAIIVAQEVLLTRLLSVTTWYSLAFVVLNLAMLGLTAGSLQAARAEREGQPLGPWLAGRMIALSAGLLAADAITVVTPLFFRADLTAFASMLLVVVANTVPLIAGGAVIARLMSRGELPISTLYAIDLIAAAGGALAPLALLGPLSGPSATAFLAALAAAGAWLIAPNRARLRSAGLIAISLAIIVLTETTSAGLLLHHAKGSNFRKNERPALERWNPLSYVYATEFVPRTVPVLWEPSPIFKPSGVYPTSIIRIDGDAWTPVHAYRDPAELTFLRYDGVTAAHWLRPRGTACVIGTGGGRDVLAALHYGHERVFGIEINPAMEDLLEKVAHVSPVIRDPRVEIVTGDGRAVLARTNIQCSVLQASLIDTWAATSAGAFAHTEATLYTREAWGLFLRRVEPNGILTFSRWYDAKHISETARLISLAMAALLDRGVERPRDHLAVLASSRCATILVSPRPFSAQDRAVLAQLESVLKWRLLVAPGRPAPDPLIEALLEAESVEALGDAGAPQGLDTSAPTDDRPFFFQLVAPRAWLRPFTVLRTMRESYGVGGGVVPGNITAMTGMMLMLLAVLLVGAVLLGPTLLASLRSSTPVLPGARAWVYFGALGAGFMLAEIALMQRMHVVLGHPTYSLVVVLASLLVATGIGSALSTRIVRTRSAVSAVAAVAGLLLALLPIVVISPLARLTMDASLTMRALWTGGCAALVGLLLGMLFPSGLRFTHREQGAPAALAVNGVTSVLGGGAAVMVSVALGIPASFALAGVCYVVAAINGPARWKPS
ncbi:MAG TPA: hypothetical protein VGQ36_29000 [Thermoanaerobaculia bacterium]|jgi:hypothetical protein|nr:hypothetical protein [Thermoanaerobaculia bacterium]